MRTIKEKVEQLMKNSEFIFNKEFLLYIEFTPYEQDINTTWKINYKVAENSLVHYFQGEIKEVESDIWYAQYTVKLQVNDTEDLEKILQYQGLKIYEAYANLCLNKRNEISLFLDHMKGVEEGI